MITLYYTWIRVSTGLEQSYTRLEPARPCWNHVFVENPKILLSRLRCFEGLYLSWPGGAKSALNDCAVYTIVTFNILLPVSASAEYFSLGSVKLEKSWKINSCF